MRTERQALPAEATDRVVQPAEMPAIAPQPSRNGHHRNGKRPTTNGVVGHPTLRPDPDWPELLPERARESQWRVGQRVKRVIDFALSSIGIVLLLPLFAVVALLIKLTSRGPVFYVCEYVGYRGRRFLGYKFRTMVEDAESRKTDLAHLNHMKGPAFKIRDDPRITGVGRLLRKYSIDELPQLWNVVRGDMSLVGPRPPLPEEWDEYKEWHRAKLAVIPGITCYWQINGRSEIVDFDDWARLDLRYIERWSLWTDVKILARTVPAVLKGHGAY